MLCSSSSVVLARRQCLDARQRTCLDRVLYQPSYLRLWLSSDHTVCSWGPSSNGRTSRLRLSPQRV